MNPILKNILAVIAGIVVGSIINMGIVMVSGHIIPPPTDSDITTMEGLAATIHLFEPKHFLFPFLAHALGTFAGALVAARIAAHRKMTMALIIGFFFLLGGITNVMILPAPFWFSMVDLVLAYIPMAWLGGMIFTKQRPSSVV